MSHEEKRTEDVLDHTRLPTTPTGLTRYTTAPAPTAKEQLHLDRLGLTVTGTFATSSELSSAPASPTSSLLSSTPTVSSASTAYPPVPAWAALNISGNVLAASSLAKNATAAVGAAELAETRGTYSSGGGASAGTISSTKGAGSGKSAESIEGSVAGCKRHTDDLSPSNLALPTAAPTGPLSSSTSVAQPASTSPPSPKRPRLVSSSVQFSALYSAASHNRRSPLRRTTLPKSDRRPLRRFNTEFLYPGAGSNFDPYPDSDSDSSSELNSITMIGHPQDESEREAAKKQVLTEGELTTTMFGVPSASIEAPSDTAASSSLSQSSLLPLQDVDLVELLDQDDRPTFVVDAANTANHKAGPLQIIFANAALRAARPILAQIAGIQHAPEAGGLTQEGVARFKTWALDLSETGKTIVGPRTPPNRKSPPSLAFAGLLWTYSTLRRRYRVVRGSRPSGTAVPSENPETPARPGSALSRKGSQPSPPAYDHVEAAADALGTDEDRSLAIVPKKEEVNASFDWTRIPVTDDIPAHIKFARSVDWASTPLGPMEQWSADLRSMSNLVMGSPHPSAMYWGPESTVIYNEAYTTLAGQKHPALMGSSYADCWPEIWDTMEPMFQSAWNAGQAVLKQDNRLFINRHGFLEETFFNWSLVPLIGSDGSVVALYNPSFENTRRKVNERRMLTLNEVGEKTAMAQTVQDFWQAVQDGLEYNEYDVPFVLIYSAISSSNSSDDAESDTSSLQSGSATGPPHVVLEGSLGVPDGHPAAVASLDLRTSDEGFAPYMRQSMSMTAAGAIAASPSTVVLSAENGTLPADLVAGLHTERGFGDPLRHVVVFPVQHVTALTTAADGSASMSVSGFVVMGTNPRRPYNRDYRLFVHLLARQLTTSLASVVLFEEEVRRSRRVARRAAQDRQELSHQLRLRTQQAVDSENKFMRMAEFTPVGMFVADGVGRITYCNDMWWEISRHPRAAGASPSSATSRSTITPAVAPAQQTAEDVASWLTWMDSVHDEDRPALAMIWDRMVEEKVVVTHEFRFKQKTTIQTESTGGEPIDITTWVLLRAFPEKDEHGNLKSIFGCITDISQQKLAEEFQIQLRQEAVEHRRQQENFIDITSHEMRNPLSAILQSVDEITNSITEFRTKSDNANREPSGTPPDVGRLLDGIVEASSTISLCANHQKRIVDDVLTLSKLDSQLLPVTPVDVQPVVVVRNTLKMFESELLAHHIRCTFRVQPSYQNLVGFGNWVKLDPSRLNQVLINLLTNAIKLTQSSEERSIVISLGASQGYSEPADSDVANTVAGLSYVPSREDNPELANGPDWGDGEKINLHLAVSDTGPGLQEDEKTQLFQHFSQTSPRTHVQYGGGGLGLFISRNLTELQGGQIGVASHKGEGSTFAFYVKARKVASTPIGVQPGSSNLSSIVEEPPSAASDVLVAYTTGGDGTDPGNCSCQTRTVTTPTLIPQLPSPPVLLPTSPAITPTESAAQLGSSTASTTNSTMTSATTNATTATAASTSAVSAVASDWTDMPELDVLIVEDNLVNQRVLQRQLDKCGNRTLVANHGGEALDILRQSTYWRATDDSGNPVRGDAASVERDSSTSVAGAAGRSNPSLLTAAGATAAGATTSSRPPSPSMPPPSPSRINISVILMDLEMPVMDGMTCARAIRALERSGTLVRHVPIIAVTAYARPEQIQSAKAAGIDDVISKPFRLAQLMPKIQELVTKYRTV